LLAAGLTLFFVQSLLHHAWRFDSLLEARVIIEGWRCDYNANRPHFAHGELTPTEDNVANHYPHGKVLMTSANSGEL